LIWPLLIWSGLGCREARLNTSQIVFCAPRPLSIQLTAAWLAGFGLAVLVGLGSLLRFGLAGEALSALSLLAGLVFIPSLALALGVWTGSSKAFEVVYVLLWYLGLLNKVTELDYIGLHGPTLWSVYAILSIFLLLAAILGRKRQLNA
jgi:hypothetical protein